MKLLSKECLKRGKSKVLMALMVGTLAVSATSVNTLAADGSVGSTSMPMHQY